jgi:hypothetical protein
MSIALMCYHLAWQRGAQFSEETAALILKASICAHDEGRRFEWNVETHLPDYTESQFSRRFSQLQVWESEALYTWPLSHLADQVFN